MSEPSVTTISPSAGPAVGGTPVIVAGDDFQNPLNPVQSVAFGATTAQCFAVDSATQITASSPSGTAESSVEVTVTWRDKTSKSSTNSFTFSTSTSTPTATQVMMTLAALATTAASERPSGETVSQQQERILAGINAQLTDPSLALATAGNWRATWVGLTQDRANMAYIAQNVSLRQGQAQQLAVCLRGTMIGSPIDMAEDMDVSALLPFAAGGTPPAPDQLGRISQGAMEAFTEIVMGTTLLQELTALVTGQTPAPTIYVTGHSLGGALATTVSLFLAAQSWNPVPSFQVYTFAAPTAGDENFANWFTKQFPTATCVWNQYDVVPNAWWNLMGEQSSEPPTPEAVEYFFPGQAGWFGSKLEIEKVVQDIAGKIPSPNPYTQPQPQQQVVLNACFGYADPAATQITSLRQWLSEVAHQHANDTYLTLLGAPTLPPLTPTVSSISPSSGPTGGSTSVTIAGTGFTDDCVVDFGVVPGTNVAFVSDSSITATSPAGAGIVDVTVTNMYGTSAVVLADQFSFSP